jgi:rare lipoprotein A
MRGSIAHGLASVLLVVSLGAAQGPTSSGSVDTQKKKPKSIAGPDTGVAGIPAKPKPHAFQVGTASWYGADFEGRETASGEPYNMYDLTAAHPSLPLGSWVRVTNLHNGRTVFVRINDRGPIIPGRIIDLSFGAARALSFRKQGLQRVRLDLVQPEQIASLRTMAY